MKKKFLAIMVAILMLTGCTKTVLVPMFYIPDIPTVLLQEPHKLDTIKPKVTVDEKVH